MVELNFSKHEPDRYGAVLVRNGKTLRYYRVEIVDGLWQAQSLIAPDKPNMTHSSLATKREAIKWCNEWAAALLNSAAIAKAEGRS